MRPKLEIEEPQVEETADIEEGALSREELTASIMASLGLKPDDAMTEEQTIALEFLYLQFRKDMDAIESRVRPTKDSVGRGKEDQYRAKAQRALGADTRTRDKAAPLSVPAKSDPELRSVLEQTRAKQNADLLRARAGARPRPKPR